MFSKTRKDRIADDARALARDLGDAISPHVDRAREEISPRVAEARDTIAPRLADARDSVADTVSPHVDNVRDRIVTVAVPAVAKAVEDAREQASEARRRGELAAAALKGEDVQRKGRKGKILVFLGVLGLGAVAAKKFLGSDESSNWQSSYSPSPAPAAPAPPPPPAPASPSGPMAGSHVADAPVGGGTVTGLSGDDTAGSTPGESLSDATEEPHPVTTPDSPIEEVPVDQDPKPGTVS